MSIQIQLRQGSASLWTSTNSTLAIGEVGIESDTLRIKVGNGYTAWNSLPYISSVSSLTASYLAGTASYATTSSYISSVSTATSASWSSASVSGSVTSTTISGQYYFDLSNGSSGLQPTYVSTGSTYNPSTNQISGSLLGITASFFGTSSWATSASYAVNAGYQSFYTTASNTSWYLTFVSTNTGSTAEYTTSSLSVNPSSGSLTATILSSSQFIGPVWTGYNVKQFGAIGNGTTDDTVAIQLAISHSLSDPNPSTRSVDLFFPPGIYKVSSPISMSGNNVSLIGSGLGSTVILNTATSGDILQIGNGVAASTNVIGVSNLQLYGNTTRTSGASLNINQANNVFVRNIGISNYFNGILIQNSSSVVRIDQGFINNGNPGSGSAITINNGPTSDTNLYHIVATNTPTTKPLKGIDIISTGYTEIFNCDITAFDYGLVFDPPTAGIDSFIYVTDCLFDSCGLAGLYVNPTGAATSKVQSIKFNNSWFSGVTGTNTVNASTNTANQPGYGIVITGSAGGIVDDISFINCRILNNYLDGIKMIYNGANNLAFIGCTIAGNSQSGSGVFNGFDIQPNFSNFTIDGCVIGTAGTATNTQKYAVNFPSSSASSSFIIKGNNVSNNNTAPYLNIGPITGSSIIANNIGDASNGVADTVLAASVATSTANETLLFNYKVPANSVRVGQTYRISGVGTSSSTGSLLFKVRVGANGTTSDNLAWTSITSSAVVANARSGFDLLGTVRSLTSFNCDGMAYANTSLIPSTIASATATITASAAWFIDVTATTNVGTFTLQECAIEAL